MPGSKNGITKSLKCVEDYFCKILNSVIVLTKFSYLYLNINLGSKRYYCFQNKRFVINIKFLVFMISLQINSQIIFFKHDQLDKLTNFIHDKLLLSLSHTKITKRIFQSKINSYYYRFIM